MNRAANHGPGGRLSALIVTNLFPSNADPGYAPFNRQQFAELGRLAEVEVFGVVPWRIGRYYASARASDVVAEETIDGLRVFHPRFPALPGVPSLNAGLLATVLAPRIAWRRRTRRIDVLLAAYAYPDGCAGVLLGRLLGLPVVVKCHGSDLNRVPEDPPARLQLQQLLPRADQVVVVSRRLAQRAEQLGVPAEKVQVVYNGVDRARFVVADRTEARRKLQLPLERKIVLYVGHLAEHKGTADLLEAAKRLEVLRPDATVVFVGDGPLTRAVQDRAERRAGTLGGVLAVGRVSQDEVAEWMSAADVLCLPSWDEGMPNVVREAHAAGRPVVATEVGGVPEAVCAPELGRLVPPRRPDLLAEALAAQLAAPPPAPEEIVRRAIVPTWRESAEALHRVLVAAVERHRAATDVVRGTKRR